MGIQQFLKYKAGDPLPSSEYPALSDHFLTLSSNLESNGPSSSVLGIVGLFPYRKPVREIDTVSFLTFNTNRTPYAALLEVEKIFADFYLRTGILPYINPLPKAYYLNPEQLPRRIQTVMSKQGAMVYGTST